MSRPSPTNPRPTQADADRPLSPHLQVYRPQISSVLSILHRLTGLVVVMGSVLLVWWLGAAAAGPDAFARAQGVLGSVPGMIILFGWSVVLFYHLCNGLRHLAWDTGWGFEIRQIVCSGRGVLGVTAALTLIAWIVGLSLA